ncbi:M56 family metallopeptidase [Flavobacterium hibisci]|uniref:M56 family metallopeptidase n=1 Tax=Flavobacterium hibisci TaxID=1914462 RepID=UPI001CC06287|nr:M56 family metallopeptidase [Flavobacterium hibisci]MBZ4040753.1 TonB-dependent receptor plug domain-containing protein [Flavobacterium hibisci]
MEALFIYIAKSSGLVILFYCAYHFLLRKETFFNSNRWFLLVGLITSIVLPFFVYTKIIWVDPAPITNLNLSQLNILQTPEKESFEINRNYIILLIYSIGFIAFLLKFAIDFYSLHAILKGKKIQQQADYKFIDVNDNISPFSYFRNIVYNSSMYTVSELENILEHEKVHSDQNHTIDVLISRFFCMVFWFNPIIWFYKKAIVQNLEFIADKEAAKKISDKRSYQYTLLKITTHENCVAITNHFYQSLIKKRIVMLNKNQSKKRNSWKYYAILPALVAFVVLFQIETIAQEKASNIIEKINPDEVQSVNVLTIDKNTTDAEIDQRVKTLKEKFNISAVVSKLKRNSNNEITSVNIDLKDEKGAKKFKKSATSTGIEKIGIIIIKDKKGAISFNFADKQPTVIDDKIEAKGVLIKIKDTQISNTNNDAKTNSDTDTNINTNVNTNTVVDTDKNIIKIVSAAEKPIIIVNGVQTNSEMNINDIPNNEIASINVLKGKPAEEKYGTTGKNGIIEITTKHSTENNKQSSNVIIQTRADSSSDKINIRSSEKPLIIIDGKITNKSTDDLDQQDIQQIDVLKDQAATSKYGDKGKNGVILITTKK